MNLGARLADAMADRGPLCVGIDPHPGLLGAWGLADSAAGVREFSLRVVEELAGTAAALKPQSAFFERHGAAGIAALEEVLAACRDAGVLSILDVKRGDIGSSMAGYAAAFLGDQAPTRADAITLSPYLGVGSLAPAIEAAVTAGHGVYVLARTSNPEGGTIQLADAGGVSTAQHIVDTIAELNPRADHAVGLVVGATHRDSGCDLRAFNASILVPGIGAQGGTVASLAAIFEEAVGNVLPTASRGVIGHGRGKVRQLTADLLADVRLTLG